jgi:hypothetical protein
MSNGWQSRINCAKKNLFWVLLLWCVHNKLSHQWHTRHINMRGQSSLAKSTYLTLLFKEILRDGRGLFYSHDGRVTEWWVTEYPQHLPRRKYTSTPKLLQQFQFKYTYSCWLWLRRGSWGGSATWLEPREQTSCRAQWKATENVGDLRGSGWTMLKIGQDERPETWSASQRKEQRGAA